MWVMQVGQEPMPAGDWLRERAGALEQLLSQTATQYEASSTWPGAANWVPDDLLARVYGLSGEQPPSSAVQVEAER